MALDTLCRLMLSDLPKTIDPIRLARAGSRLEGSLETGIMERLAPLLMTPDGHVDFRLDFLQDSDGVNIVESECCTALSMQCQRCFNPVAIEIHTHSRLVVVASEEAARDIPADCEPLLFNGENLDLARMIEEEILLALPIAPRHEHEQCHAGTRDSLAGNRGKNPFSILKNLEL